MLKISSENVASSNVGMLGGDGAWAGAGAGVVLWANTVSSNAVGWSGSGAGSGAASVGSGRGNEKVSSGSAWGETPAGGAGGVAGGRAACVEAGRPTVSWMVPIC